ncbi:nicotinamide mononucleotide transporter [bacterium]|nr:nicotinamide mononucleotide transporter [bacterium]
MELALALTSLLGLAALSQGRRWGWLLATLSSLGYVDFFWRQALPGQAFLNLVYALSQAWGARENPIFRSQPWTWRWWLLAPLIALPLLRWLTPGDACLTALALVAQALTAQKVSQVWRAWVLIDLASSAFYVQHHDYATAALYLILAGVAEAAHRTWCREDAVPSTEKGQPLCTSTN